MSETETDTAVFTSEQKLLKEYCTTAIISCTQHKDEATLPPRLQLLLRHLENAVPNQDLMRILQEFELNPLPVDETAEQCGPVYDKEPPLVSILWDRILHDRTFGKKSILYWLRDVVFDGDLTNHERGKGVYRTGFSMLASLGQYAITKKIPTALIVPLIGRCYAMLRRASTVDISSKGNYAALISVITSWRAAAKKTYPNGGTEYSLIHAMTVTPKALAASRMKRSIHVREAKQLRQLSISFETLYAVRAKLFLNGGPWERFVLLLMCTGSRPIELAILSQYEEKECSFLRVSNLAKKRTEAQYNERTAPILGFSLFTVCNIVAYLAQLREDLCFKYEPDASSTTRQYISKLVSQFITKVIRREFTPYVGEETAKQIDARALRSIYANEAYEVRSPAQFNMSRNAYIACILGHSNMDSAPSYQGWNVHDLPELHISNDDQSEEH